MVIEVEDVERMYRQVIEKGLPVRQELTTQTWGQSKLLRAGAERTHAVPIQRDARGVASNKVLKPRGATSQHSPSTHSGA